MPMLWIARTLPICKVVHAPPSMECALAFPAIEPAASNDWPLYLDRAVQCAAEHATEINALFFSVFCHFGLSVTVTEAQL